MNRCFYCMDESHTALACKLKQDDELGKARKRRLKKWGYMPAEELMPTLTQHLFVPQHLSWLVYFFRYSHIDGILKSGLQSTTSGDIYSDPELIEAERLLSMGQEKFKQGDHQQAVVILDLVLKKNHQGYRARILKGYAHIEGSELDQALASFASAVEIAPSNYYRSLAWLLMARVNQCKREVEQAIIQAQRAICSQILESHYLLSILYIEKGLVEEGLAQLQLAIQEDREYLVARCYEPAFSPIEPELNFLLDNIIQQEKREADQQLERLRAMFQEVEKLEVKLYDPLGLKNARLKCLMAGKKHETQSYFGYIDTIRLANESVAYLETAKSSTVARKRLGLYELKEYIQLSLRNCLLYGVCAAGWGLAIGGGIGIVLALKFGPGSEYKIITSAIKGAAIGFLVVYVYNWRVTHYKKKFFLSRFAKRFQHQRGKQNPK